MVSTQRAQRFFQMKLVASLTLPPQSLSLTEYAFALSFIFFLVYVQIGTCLPL